VVVVDIKMILVKLKKILPLGLYILVLEPGALGQLHESKINLSGSNTGTMSGYVPRESFPVPAVYNIPSAFQYHKLSPPVAAPPSPYCHPATTSNPATADPMKSKGFYPPPPPTTTSFPPQRFEQQPQQHHHPIQTVEQITEKRERHIISDTPEKRERERHSNIQQESQIHEQAYHHHLPTNYLPPLPPVQQPPSTMHLYHSFPIFPLPQTQEKDTTTKQSSSPAISTSRKRTRGEETTVVQQQAQQPGTMTITTIPTAGSITTTRDPSAKRMSIGNLLNPHKQEEETTKSGEESSDTSIDKTP
jgi:hypothetical protein